VPEKTSRFWDAVWVVVPLVIGGLIGFYFAGQFPASSLDCTQPTNATPSTAANFALAVVLVVLLVLRFVAKAQIGPVAGRIFTMAALGLVVAACGSYFVSARSEACPTAAIASSHEAMVRIPHAALYLSG
jgi:hypothetical protein